MAENEPQSLPVRNVARGAFSGITEARLELITKRAKWEQVWGQHTLRTKPPEKLPEIDFGKETLVLATMGRQTSGGYSIEIAKVERAPDHLLISIRKTKPRPGAMTIQSLTAPFHIVAVPKTDLPARFRELKAPESK